MTVLARELGVTHLVNEDAALDVRRQAGLYQDLLPQRLIEAVASVPACEIGSAPHRAPGDAAVEKLRVQIIEEPLEDSPSVVMRHSRAVTIVSPVSNELFARPNGRPYLALALRRSAQYFFIRRLTSRFCAADIGLRRRTVRLPDVAAAAPPPRRSPGKAR